jgi:hypothetical protein
MSTPGTQNAGFRKVTYVAASKCVAENKRGLNSAADVGTINCWADEISPGFFATMRPHVISGRIPSDAEITHGAPVAVVTKSVATRLFGGHALGNRIHLDAATGSAATIVGVVDDVREPSDELGTRLTVFVSDAAALLPRAFGPDVRELWMRPSFLTPGYLRMIGQRLTANRSDGVEISGAESLEATVKRTQNAYRQLASIVIALFVVALAMSALGIYGLVSNTVTARTRELAIRESLGARRAQIVALIVKDAIIQCTIGVAAGTLISACILRYLNTSDFDAIAVAIIASSTLPIVYGTVAFAAFGPVRSTWRRGISIALRTDG